MKEQEEGEKIELMGVKKKASLRGIKAVFKLRDTYL